MAACFLPLANGTGVFNYRPIVNGKIVKRKDVKARRRKEDPIVLLRLCDQATLR
jgi:hypothetical protein